MKIVIDDILRDVIITRKRSNKNTYLRVREDLNIYVTTNYLTSEKEIEKIISKNISTVRKMLKREIKRKEQENVFYYLGKKYDIVYINSSDVIIGEDKIFISQDINLDKWLLKEALTIFKRELDKIYKIFPREIPYPYLTIRKMKTRWGVCNIKTKRVTLNFELIKKDIKYLDYVIVHELSHLIVSNHQKEFWSLVEEIIPNYKELRKEMRNYE